MPLPAKYSVNDSSAVWASSASRLSPLDAAAPVNASSGARTASRTSSAELLSKGIHACLGQQLARAEIRVSLERIFDRTTAIEIARQHHGPAGDRRYSYDPTSFFRGLTELHLRLVPDRAELCSD